MSNAANHDADIRAQIEQHWEASERLEHGESLSEIAIRCGRIRRNRDGSASGETSWLSRRVGLSAEGGQSDATPWVHSDVLALIARDGLNLSPVEVEAH